MLTCCIVILWQWLNTSNAFCLYPKCGCVSLKNATADFVIVAPHPVDSKLMI